MATVTIPSKSFWPVARPQPQNSELHGDVRCDPYHWLRHKHRPEVIDYLAQENRYMAAVMEPTEELQHKLYREMVSRIEETDQTVPVRRGEYLYYTRTERGKQYTIYCRQPALGGAEEILLDGNHLAEGEKYFRIGVFSPSPDHRLLAYSIDTEGDEVYTVRVKDLATGQLLPDTLTGTYYDLEWANDNRTLFFNRVDDAKRPHQLWRHRLGDATSTLIFTEPDERFNLGLSKTRSRAWMILTVSSATSSEVWRWPADSPEAPPVLFYARRPNIEYDVTHQGDRFYIRTNDQGRNFRLVEVPVADPAVENWREILPHRPAVLLESVIAFAEHLVLIEREGGLRRIRLGLDHNVEFPHPVYHVFPHSNPEYHATHFRFEYTSMVTPPTVIDYDLVTHERTIRKTMVVHGYDAEAYATERVLVRAADGAQVPVALVYRRDCANGARPTMLYGYGSYGLNTEPVFNAERLSLLDRGWVWAIAQIRGGSELGTPWHDDGKMMRKRNTFTDFIACAEHLIAAGYTVPEKLAIMGRSAGGLLMGAVLNERPDLFQAAIAGVPFVDVLNTMLDASLPLTVGEYEEWGNPNEAEAYHYMKSYSPYDNVAPQDYPHLLVLAGLNDPRVQYWEPAKWVAKLRATKLGDREVLLKTEMGAGHFGPSGRYERFKETAFEYAFLLQYVR
ncbi:MAG: S9 family peptidase [Bryobacteraceae bacterium]|nr:S9 family peptidase [Bryobacteraceae bacterium]